MGYHAELAQKRRVEAMVQRELDRELARQREEAKAKLSDSLRHLVELPVASAAWPSMTWPYGHDVLHPYKVWTRPPIKRRKPDAFPCGNVIEMWHGTKSYSLKSIASSGLHTGGEACLFGSGIYLTRDIEKASRYGLTFDGYGSTLTLLRCAVATGSYTEGGALSRSQHNAEHIGPGKQFNSVWARPYAPIGWAWNGSVAGEEWVVYDPSQVEVLDIFVWRKGVNPRPQPKPPTKQRYGFTAAMSWRRNARLKGGHREVILRHHCCVKNGNPCCYAEVSRGTLNLESRCDWHGFGKEGKIINRDIVGLTVLRPLCSHFTPKEK